MQGQFMSPSTRGKSSAKMNSMILGQHNTPEYYARMASSLGNKRHMLPHVTPGRVVDVGYGGGDFSLVLQATGNTVTSVDAHPLPVEGLDTVEAYADEVHHHIQGVDTVIASSVLHEVFSYGNRNQQVGHIDSLSAALTSFRATLRTGGTLIIRDGVRVERPYQSHIMKLLTPDGDDFLNDFYKASPFTKRGLDRHIRPFTYDKQAENWRSSASAIMEFLFTYTWGRESLPREAQEFYGIFSLGAYGAFVEQFGFSLVHKETFTQEGYVNNLAPLASTTMQFPATNALWVFRAQ